jgi:hypothetical protein
MGVQRFKLAESQGDTLRERKTLWQFVPSESESKKLETRSG